MRRAAALSAIVMALSAAGCATQAQPAPVLRCVATPGEAPFPTASAAAAAGTPSAVQLGPGMGLSVTDETLAASRQGTPLRLAGVVRSTDCHPLNGATLHAWNANGNGLYGPPSEGSDVRCCYLQGTLLTDTQGRYSIETVMPGSYGSRPHIHVELSHPSARGLLTEVEFAGSNAAVVTETAGGFEAQFDFVLATR